jgi:hypothetical protein
MRVLAIGCLDILLTLPFGILTLYLLAKSVFPGAGFPFYYGWGIVHGDWAPFVRQYSDFLQAGFWNIFAFYFQQWTSPVLGLAIFALFGATSEARAAYWRGICSAGKVVGWRLEQEQEVDEMVFGSRHPTEA